MDALDKVIGGGYCIGCGACAAVKNSPYVVKLNKFGCYEAEKSTRTTESTEQICGEVCPFSETSDNEIELTSSIFDGPTNKYLGRHLACFGGYVTSGNFREMGSSGGFAKWIGARLLEIGEIDYFIQVRSQTVENGDEPLFEYEVFSNPDSVIKGSKSCYYPTTLTSVFEKIREQPGRYAITGVPCFIKAIRLMSKYDNCLLERIKFTVGIVCGGMKSANHSKLVGWQLGVHPDDLVGIDFRKKYKDRPATQKQYEVVSKKDSKPISRNAAEIFGTDYASGMFKPKACDFCDDVVGELADVSVGDAWLDQYRNDPKGTSLIIVRNPVLLKIINEATTCGLLATDRITSEQAIQSQSGGFRHRREGLGHRLSLARKKQEWTPPKRENILPTHLSSKRKKIYEMRAEMTSVSHEAFANALNENDLNLFIKRMMPLWRKYQSFAKPSLYERIKRRFR